jgi:hypothetical protein
VPQLGQAAISKRRADCAPPLIADVRRHLVDAAEINAWADAYIRAYREPDLLKDDHPLWWAVEKAMYCIEQTNGDALLQFVLAVTDKEPPASVLAVLAAGPLEELIAYSGQEFIDRIEVEARRNPRFRYLLGGVWQHGTPEPIWARVEAARDKPW